MTPTAEQDSTPAEEREGFSQHSDASINVRPEATFDPTPDTKVPPRGHTSFDRESQTERVAANKGKRARMGNHRKH